MADLSSDMPALAAALAAGEDARLLAPLRLVAAGGVPAPAPPADRAALAEALAVSNAAYEHPRAEELAARLADPATRVVVTGQQPGLLGGPLYTLVKAAAAALWAERLTAAGEPAVAVFWVATEDHDFREVAQAIVPGPEGPMDLDLGADPAPLQPVGMRALGGGVEAVLRSLAAAPGGDRQADWVETLGRWYRPQARFGEAFSRLFAHLLGERGPLLLDAMEPALKQAERPYLRRLVERRQEVELALTRREALIAAAGRPLQVAAQPGASPLFLLHGSERRRVEWEGGDSFRLRGVAAEARPVEELLAILDDNPGVVSPGVLARPAVADAVLGTSLQVVGPGELAYLTQAASLYDVLEVAAPAVALRPRILVVESHQHQKLDTVPVGLDELAAPEFDLDRALGGARGDALLAPARRRVEELRGALEAAAAEVAPELDGPLEKTVGQVERALGAFGGRLEGALARRHETARRRLEQLRAACRPLGRPQERVISSAHFPGKYGPRFGAALLAGLDLDAPGLQIVTPPGAGADA